MHNITITKTKNKIYFYNLLRLGVIRLFKWWWLPIFGSWWNTTICTSPTVVTRKITSFVSGFLVSSFESTTVDLTFILIPSRFL